MYNYAKKDIESGIASTLIQHAIDDAAEDPAFIEWKDKAKDYLGWHLVYTDQCPWHYKSVNDLQKVAQENGIVLNVTKLTSHIDAQNAPSGFAGFNLIHNGELLEDHYIGGTRFKNIIKKKNSYLTHP